MPTASSSSKGFSLFELLLVVVLISVLYGVFVHKLSTPKNKIDDALTLKNLTSYLSTLEFRRKVEVICLEPCSSCDLYIDGKKANEEGFKLFKSSPKVYFPDRFGQVRPIDFLPMLSPEGSLSQVCFHYTLRANGSGSHFALEDGKDYYLFNPYMYPVQVVKSFADVSAFFDNSKKLPNDKRDYAH